MKFLGFDKVLCLSPHPDDVEYSISGTIMKYYKTHFEVLSMTTGTQADITSKEERFYECKLFWEKLKLPNSIFTSGFYQPLDSDLLFYDFDNVNESEWIKKIESKYNISEYDAILAPSDSDSHYEHLITNRIMVALGRNKPISLIEYKSPSTLRSWEPNYFVNIYNEINIKISNLKLAFKSQLDADYFNDDCLQLFHQDYISRKKGIDFVEQFKIKTHYGL